MRVGVLSPELDSTNGESALRSNTRPPPHGIPVGFEKDTPLIAPVEAPPHSSLNKIALVRIYRVFEVKATSVSCQTSCSFGILCRAQSDIPLL